MPLFMKANLLLLLLIIYILPLHSQEKTKVLLVGTYHFGGQTTDPSKVEGDMILGEAKQKELGILLEKLAQFSPQKIYVENVPSRQQRWDSIYFKHKNGHLFQYENEIYQVGVKLASKLNLENGVTCVDWQMLPAETFLEKQYRILENKIDDYYEAHDIPDVGQTSLYEDKALEEILDFNKRIPRMELLKVFQHLNTNEHLDKVFYTNISSFLDVDKYQLHVATTQHQMQRNVFIYKNIIQDILKEKPKRVMVLYGSAHIKALRDYLEAHPAVEIVNTTQVLAE